MVFLLFINNNLIQQQKKKNILSIKSIITKSFELLLSFVNRISHFYKLNKASIDSIKKSFRTKMKILHKLHIYMTRTKNTAIK